MKITDLDGIKGAGKPKKPKKTGDGGAFDALLGAEEAGSTEDSKAPTGAAPLEAAGSLLSLQEVPAHTGLRQQTIQQGKKSIDILDDLRRDLLLGDDSPQLLQRMREQQSRLNAQAHDPQLKPVMDDIDLRLAVEIAKREAALV